MEAAQGLPLQNNHLIAKPSNNTNGHGCLARGHLLPVNSIYLHGSPFGPELGGEGTDKPTLLRPVRHREDDLAECTPERGDLDQVLMKPLGHARRVILE